MGTDCPNHIPRTTTTAAPAGCQDVPAMRCGVAVGEDRR